ncbi:glycosyltransferase family 32 protein [Microbulbifer epialgicus]|uniref:Glycosyltransferase family 32 protein n=1 Tax=Microbulbifer epialgicus TaxID=393907 RepID=A0ABV4P3L3_9GAMM
MSSHNIPKIIHQTWKDDSIPIEYQSYVRSVKKFHSDWEYKLWTDTDMLNFVKDFYPEFLCIYQNYHTVIQKCDFFRYLIVKHFGGFYLDLDVEIICSLSELIDQQDNVFFVEKILSREECIFYGNRDSIRISNYAFGTIPHHIFWDYFLTYLIQPRFSSRPITNDNDILESTGPGILTTVFHDYNKSYNTPLNVLKPSHSQESACSCKKGVIPSCTVGKYGYHAHFGTWRL